MTIRDPNEIQRAHDLLIGILLGETPYHLTKEAKGRYSMMACVLCWVLQHDHNPRFAELLKEVEAAIKEAGLELYDDSN